MFLSKPLNFRFPALHCFAFTGFLGGCIGCTYRIGNFLFDDEEDVDEENGCLMVDTINDMMDQLCIRNN